MKTVFAENKKKLLAPIILTGPFIWGLPTVVSAFMFGYLYFRHKTHPQRKEEETMTVTCPINGGILVSLNLSEEVAELATKQAKLTGKHIQTLLREASKPIIESGRKPTEKDFREYLDGLSAN